MAKTNIKSLKYIEGEPPEGYQPVTFSERPEIPVRWYLNAVRVSKIMKKPLADYIMTHKKEGTRLKYVLWVKKTKGEGKVVGKGFSKDIKKLERKR